MDFIQDKISAMKQKYGFAVLSSCITFLKQLCLTLRIGQRIKHGRRRQGEIVSAAS
jgi:hypothetical protein